MLASVPLSHCLTVSLPPYLSLCLSRIISRELSLPLCLPNCECQELSNACGSRVPNGASRSKACTVLHWWPCQQEQREGRREIVWCARTTPIFQKNAPRIWAQMKPLGLPRNSGSWSERFLHGFSRELTSENCSEIAPEFRDLLQEWPIHSESVLSKLGRLPSVLSKLGGLPQASEIGHRKKERRVPLSWLISSPTLKPAGKQPKHPKQLLFRCFGCFPGTLPRATFFGCFPAVFKVGR